VKLISKWSGAALCCAVSVALLGTLLYAASAGTSHIPINEKVRVTGVIPSRNGDLIARRTSTWTIDEHLGGRSPECVAVDLRNPAQVYCGTARDGLFRSCDCRRNWEPAGPGIDHPMITAVDVGHARQADGFGIVYAGTEPSAVFRSSRHNGRPPANLPSPSSSPRRK